MKSTVLVAIDNRQLSMKIDAYITEEKYEIKYALFSRNAFKFFIITKPRFVILDVSAPTNYLEIIENLEHCKWKYNVILLANNHKDVYCCEKYSNVFPILKNNLSAKVLIEAMDKLEQTDTVLDNERQITQREKTVYSEKCNGKIVSIIIIKNTRKTQKNISYIDIREIKTLLEIYVDIYEIKVVDEDIFISINGFNIRSELSIYDLGNHLLNYMPKQYAVFIIKNTAFLKEKDPNLEEKINQVVFFSEGLVIDLNKNYKHSNLKKYYIIIEKYGAKIIENILIGKREEAIASMHKMFKFIFRSKDIVLVEYERFIINMIFYICNIVSRGENMDFEFIGCTTYQEEVKIIESYIMSFCDVLSTTDINIIVSKCISFMVKNLSKDVSLSCAADDLCITKNYISKLFNNSLGITFLDFLKSLKMKKAKFLLSNTKYKVKEISLLVGYNDSHYFTKDFKKNAKLAPEDYRKNSKRYFYESTNE